METTITLEETTCFKTGFSKTKTKKIEAITENVYMFKFTKSKKSEKTMWKTAETFMKKFFSSSETSKISS